MPGWNESAWFSFALGAALKSTVLLGAAWILAWALRRRSSAARHLIWTAAAAAVLALPWLTATLPALTVGGAGTVLDSSVWLRSTASAPDVATAPPLPVHGVAVVKRRVAPGPSPWRPDWRRWLLLLWAAGVAVGGVQLAVACAVLWRARRESRPFADQDLVAALSRSLGIAGGVEVRETAQSSMPMTFGLFRPTVFLPEGAAEWPEERRRLVLLHELAHVRRGDAATQWLARAALSLHWWNPLAWTVWRAFLKERERAADDLVLEAGARASDYASFLLEAARTLQSRPAVGWAAIPMARPSQLEGRLLAILDPTVRRGAPRGLAVAAATLLAVAVVAPLAAVHAQGPADPSLPLDIDAAIRAANVQKNHEILDRAAQAAATQGKLDLARKLLDASVEIRRQVSGQQSVDYGVGLMKLGELAQREGRTEEAMSYYTRAVEAIGERPEAAQALLKMGVIAFTPRDPEKSFGYFQQAERADPVHAQAALMWMAVVRARRDETASEAESLFQRALEQGSPDSLERAVVLDVYAGLLRRTGRADEAAALTAQAGEVRKSWRNRNGGAATGTALPEGVFKIGNGVTAPVPIFKPEPEYSEEARLAKYQGDVTLTIEIGPDGATRNIRVVQGLGLGLDEKAVDGVSRWRFRPGTKDGVPVTVLAQVTVNFRLL
jgi:TonB family protein